MVKGRGRRGMEEIWSAFWLDTLSVEHGWLQERINEKKGRGGGWTLSGGWLSVDMCNLTCWPPMWGQRRGRNIFGVKIIQFTHNRGERKRERKMRMHAYSNVEHTGQRHTSRQGTVQKKILLGSNNNAIRSSLSKPIDNFFLKMNIKKTCDSGHLRPDILQKKTPLQL